MKIHGSYPHPVVGNGSDATGRLSPRLMTSNTRDTINIQLSEISVTNEAISALVKDGKATYVIRLESSGTGMRKSYTTPGPEFDISLPLSELHSELKLEVAAIALAPISNYSPTGAHQDYGGQKFKIDPGDILAVTSAFNWSIDDDWDPLKTPIQSIMRITRTTDKLASMKVSFDTEKILIQICKEDFAHYISRKYDSAAIIHSAIIFPVLVVAIASLNNPDYVGLQWHRRLTVLIDRLDIDDEQSPLETAQQLLRLPINRSFSQLDKILAGESNHE